MEKITIINQPSDVSIKLHVHQRYNIYKAYMFEQKKSIIMPNNDVIISNVGIFGDPVGTGKTLTVLGLVCYSKAKGNLEDYADLSPRVFSNGLGNVCIYRGENGKKINTTVVLTSLSVFSQWESELKKTKLKYNMIKSRNNMSDVEKYDVVVLTITMYKSFTEYYNNHMFKRFVYDEMDSAYVPAMTAPKAEFTWLISATYEKVLEEIKNWRHFLKRTFSNGHSLDQYDIHHVIQKLTIKSPQKLLDLCKIEYKCNIIHYNVKSSAVVRHFEGYLDSEIIEMIESGNVNDAIQRLGGDHSDSSIAEVMRKRALSKVNEATIALKVFKLKNPNALPSNERLLDLEERIKRAQGALDNIEERIESMKNEDCPVCYEEIKTPTLLNCCQNVACAQCITTCVVKMKSCPFCRTANPALTSFNNQSDEKNEGNEGNGGIEEKKYNEIENDKYDIVSKIISNGKKVLLFSSHDDYFSTIVEYLKMNNISCATVKGHSSHRDKMIDSYMNGDTKVLILNSRMNGAGLNLQKTTDIVLWHSMGPEITQQIIGRAFRIGLDHDVNIHKLFPKY